MEKSLTLNYIKAEHIEDLPASDRELIAEAQKAGGIAAFIDAEHAFDPYYAQKLGVDVDNLLVSQPDNGEQALEIADSLIRSSAIDIIVIDSVAALTPKAEIVLILSIDKLPLRQKIYTM